MIVLQPNLVEAQQAVITVDPSSKASMDKTLNNTPLLNIVAPNASGVSHNKFTDFNVGKPGLVINNSLQDTNTKIGGAILGNQNFNGRSASLILNEVTSSNRSRLEGFTEIAGDKADYILANPNGITCNGCGFINTSRSTLTTGTPTFNGTALESLSVEGGDILIDSLGLNASETDAFDIITRAAKIGGVLQGKDVRVVAGRNDVKYDDLSVTKKADDGSLKPSLAIDSTALGGMYAGRIALIANETGVGVNMQGDLAASSSELTLSADGKIVLKKASAQNDLNVTSNTAIEVGENGQVYAGNDLSLKGGDVNATSATLAAANDVSLTGRNITTTNSTLAAGQQSDGSAGSTGDLTLNATGTLSAEGASLSSVETLTLKGNAITDGTGANGLRAKGDVSIVSTTSTALNGDIQSGGDVTATGNSITVKNMSAGGAVNIEATEDATTTGHLQAGAKATLSGKTITTNTITAGDDISLTATTAATLSGKTKSNKNITVTAPTLNAGELVAVGDLTLKGSTRATTTGDMAVGGDLSLTGGALATSGGTAEIGGNTTIDGATYTAKNTLETGGNLNVTTTGNTVVETGAQLVANGTASISAQNITTDGTISSQTGTTLTATQSITATANAKTQSAKDTTFAAGTTLSNAGMLTASEKLNLTAANIINAGTLAGGSTDTMVIEVTSDLTNSGLIYTPGSLTFKTPGTLTNDEGDILANGNIQIDADGNGTKNTKVWNYSGNIESLNGGITINTEELLNERKGLVISAINESTSSSKTLVSSPLYVHSNGDERFFENYSAFYSDAIFINSTKIYALHNTTVSKTTASSDKRVARINSNNDLEINATNIINKSSQIQTNKNLHLAGQNLVNSGYATATTATTVTLRPDIEEASSDAGGTSLFVKLGSTSTSSTSTVTDPGDTFITAGGDITGSFTDKIDNVSIFGGADPVTISQGSANVHATSADIGLPTAETINSNVALPTGVGGMFITNTTKGAEYAIVTNPAIASLNALYSSDYFMDRIGTNVKKDMETTLRLGDAAWEMYSVRNQIMATTHQRYLSPNVTSDADQYKALMDNALAQHESLELSYGIALTSEQINALTDDIVWMVEVTLEDGRKALKPVVYFAEATRLAIDSSGALIKAGGNLTLTAANDITNSGTLSGANTDLTSTDGSLINDYGKLAATDGNLTVTTDQNIINTGGLLTSEGNITLAAANGNVTNTTETWRQSETYTHDGDKRVVLAYNDTTGAQARITAKNGNIDISAGQSIKDTSGALKAEGDLNLTAEQDITFAAVNTGTRRLKDQKNLHTTITTTKQTGADLTVGGSLSLNAGNTATLQGTKATIGGRLKIDSGGDTIITAVQSTETVREGNLGRRHVRSSSLTNDLATLKAGGNLEINSGKNVIANGVDLSADHNVNITSAENTAITSVQDTYREDIVSKKYQQHRDENKTIASSITAGKNVKVTTGADTVIRGTKVTSGNDLTLTAGTNGSGSVLIAANQDRSFSSSSSRKSGFMGSSSHQKTSETITQVSSVLTAGGDVTVNAANDVSVVASAVNATGDLTVAANDNISLIAGQNTTKTTEQKSKPSGFNLGVVSYNTMSGSANQKGSSTTVSSELSGDNVRLQTGADINMLGSNVFAENEATLDVAGTLNVQNASDTKESFSSSYKSSSLNAVIPVYFFDINLGYNSAKSKTSNIYDEVVVGSRIKSGTDLNINVGQDANITGSELEAGKDLNLNVAGDVNLATAQNVHSESHSETKQSGFNVGVSYMAFNGNIGQTKMENTERSTLDVINEGTLLKAENDLNVTADNVTIVSGELTSGQDTTVEADNELVMATAQDVHQNSVSTNKGKTTSVGGSFGFNYGNANINVGGTASKGKQTTHTTVTTDTIQQGTDITAGNDVTLTSGADTTLTNTDVSAGGDVTVEAGGDVNLQAAADTHVVDQIESTTKTSSVGATVGASLNYDNGGKDSTFGSKDGQFTTGNLSVGVTHTKSKTTTTQTTTTETTHKGTTLTSGGTTTVTANDDVSIENTETTGNALSGDATVTAGGTVTETTLEDTVETVSTTTTTSTSSTEITGPDLKQFVLDSVGNVVAEVGANKIGDLKTDGTVDPLTHKVLHAANGAVQGAISSGGDLDAAAAGAIGAAVGEITAEIAGDFISSKDEDRSKKITYAATTAAMIAANLLGQDSNIAKSAASNAVVNNRLLHTAEIMAIEKTAEEMAKTKGGTKEEWLTRLGNEALRQVDEEKARELPQNDEALAILKTIDHYGDGFTDKLGNQLKFLSEDNQFKNPSLFASTVMANKDFYDVVLKDYAPVGYENLKGVVSGSTLAVSNALKEIFKSSNVVGGSDELNLTDEERINRTLELIETSKQIYQVRKELKEKSKGNITGDQKADLFLLTESLDITKTKIIGGITQTMQKGFNQGATKFVVENAEAFGLLLYDTTTPVWLADGDAAARNMDRAEGVIYLLKNWDSLPEQIADNFKSTMLDAKQKLDAGDHVGGMEIYGELTVKLGSSALSGLKLSADIASALGKIGATISRKASSTTGDLPSGYTELKGVGADASSADLPEGFKRVVDPDGNIKYASSEGKVYDTVQSAVASNNIQKLVVDSKIQQQMSDRGWTKQDIDALIHNGRSGKTTDNRRPNKTDDGLGRNDTATVYGSSGNYVIVNDRTGEIVQVSGRNDPTWIDDGRIQWK
ncbi:hemagglutinin repeat-containing protein [Terasakiella pusilla]|uniref:two-partner secretion domain-containing protein n=1 Tax=Terasakiella pusilla TaxID=64973 RepID=UPI003AA90F03